MIFDSLLGKKKSFLGVDIGTASIKLVELTAGPNNVPRLLTYGRAEESIDFTKADSEEDIKRIVATLKEICRRAKTKSQQTVSALPSFTVFSSVISLPTMSPKELAAAVKLEARKFVPLPVEEMILDWKILSDKVDKPSEETKNIRVLLTAAPQNVVRRYLEIFKRAELELLSLETEAFALERSLVGGSNEIIMIVDIGAVTTDISVIENSIPILSRSIDVGGFTITKAIGRSLNIDLRRAEQFKRDIGLTTASSSGNNGIIKTIENTIGPIINEIKYTFNLYQSQSPKGIDKIILTGGSSFLPGLDSYLSDIFQLKVYVGDPWAQISYPTEMKPILDEIGPQFASAIGLAMRELI
ncbi:type IV pilus assembly protein PilM [Patescibacteria group bacterium]|nr:type IV pilus assembly protein PilM [Patescibacteria group bacterium]